MLINLHWPSRVTARSSLDKHLSHMMHEMMKSKALLKLEMETSYNVFDIEAKQHVFRS
jgi:hypothetical protein